MENSLPPHLLCFGLGFTAAALIRRARGRGWRITGTARDPDRLDVKTRADHAASGVSIHRFDATHRLDRSLFGPLEAGGASLILTSVPPGEAGDPVLAAHGEDIAKSAARWVGYLSTTGVYGDRAGGWVDESGALEPTTERGRRRVDAERAWLALRESHGLPVHLFRLAGIYGPGRNALTTVRAGGARRAEKPGQVFSRIHVDDIAAVLDASIARPNPGAAYNVCDDEPAPPQDVIEYACRLIGAPVPPLEPIDMASLSEMGRSFYAENKRVHNDRIKRELGVELAYPTYREGLDRLLADGE